MNSHRTYGDTFSGEREEKDNQTMVEPLTLGVIKLAYIKADENPMILIAYTASQTSLDVVANVSMVLWGMLTVDSSFMTTSSQRGGRKHVKLLLLTVSHPVNFLLDCSC